MSERERQREESNICVCEGERGSCVHERGGGERERERVAALTSSSGTCS